MKRESGTLLGVGTAYLPVKEIKGEFYVKVSDFTRCMDGIRIEQEADRKHIEQLEEENKNLNKHLGEEIDTIQVLIREKYEEKEKKLELLKENKNLKKKIEILDNENMCLNAEIKDREEENKKLKSDLSECECSMHFENDEVGYRKRECKKLKEELSKLKEKYGDIDY